MGALLVGVICATSETRQQVQNCIGRIAERDGYENAKLNFAGRVGTGFSEKLLKSLSDELNKIGVKDCPFYNLPAIGRGVDPGLTVAKMRRCI
jgi:ATP-dependent DNA ligase